VISISVVGTVQVRRDGALITVPSGKTTELLVRLALTAGKPVRSDVLIEDLWGDDAITTTRNTLQAKVTRLRRALADPTLLVAVDEGYILNVEPTAIDVFIVRAALDEARELVQSGDHRAIADHCRVALQAFQGETLPGAGHGNWAHQHRAQIEATRNQLTEIGLAARLELTEPGDVIGDLEAAVAADLYQEGLWRLLIIALYRCGRQAAAMDAFQRIRRLLADDLGLDPGPALLALQNQILSHDPTLEPRHLTMANQNIQNVVTGNLPALAVELVGRNSEIETISTLIDGHRLVEIVGPGGVGKTAVAIAVGRLASKSNSSGAWLVRLEEAKTAAEVHDTLLAAMKVSGGQTALFERLRTTDALIILDNCEHVLDAAIEVVSLLLAAPGVRVLCTSQVPLGIDGGTTVELAPLALDAAVELFIRRANSNRPARRSIEAAGATRELCRSLDGLPLAIELAAARTKTFSIEEITRRLDDRFTVLADPTSRRSERRRALKATIRWSYDLLFTDDQRGLWALSTFAGGAALAAIEHVLVSLNVPAAATIDVVDRLAKRSLLIVDDRDSTSPRYRLLDSIHAFSRDEVAAAQFADIAHSAHAAWYATAAAVSTAGVRSGKQADYLAFARTERANIDTALAWAANHDPLLALAMANGFGWAWLVLGDSRGASRIMSALDALGDAAPPAERAAALLNVGWIEASTGGLDVARAHIEEATTIAEGINDVELLARCSSYLAYVVSHYGDFAQGIDLTDRSRDLLSQLDRPWDQAANELFAARAAISAGDHERSIEAVGRVDRWVKPLDDPWLEVRREAVHGELARLQGRFADAVRHIQRAAETSRISGFLQTEAYQTASLARAHSQAGDYETGAAILQLSIAKAEAIGDARMAALARVHLGRILRATGDIAGSRAALETACDWHRGNGGGEQAALGECLLAVLDLGADVAGADVRVATILDAARRNNDAHIEVFALDALGWRASRHGDQRTAEMLCTEADQRMTVVSHFISERDRVDATLARRSSRN
jgi:predicted ATPase/DNA-binding SARP family transcriptional activator